MSHFFLFTTLLSIVYYSKKYKLFDLVINKNNNFYKHFHLETIKEINEIINNNLKMLYL